MERQSTKVEKRYKLKDGGQLTITKSNSEVFYRLTLPDGREMVLYKMEKTCGIIVMDSNGAPVMTLGCDS